MLKAASFQTSVHFKAAFSFFLQVSDENRHRRLYPAFAQHYTKGKPFAQVMEWRGT
jgi:predicted 3-demethylubiquinone-9 3-methyltransferase (glyoxalase superfamily)